jgi:hypothetical protein
MINDLSVKYPEYKLSGLPAAGCPAAQVTQQPEYRFSEHEGRLLALYCSGREVIPRWDGPQALSG